MRLMIRYMHDRQQYLLHAIFVTSITQRIRTSCIYAIFQIVFFHTFMGLCRITHIVKLKRWAVIK